MEKLGKVIIFFVFSIFISTIVFVGSVDYVLPKINYVNQVSFQLAYLNYDDALVVAFKEDESQKEHSLSKFEIVQGNQLKDLSLELPYEYAPTLYFLFGESHPVDLAITNIIVNGKFVEIDQIVNGLKDVGYHVQAKNGVVYAQHKDDVKIGALDVYKLSKDFVHYEKDELLKYQKEENNLKLIYFTILCLILSTLFHLLLKYISKYFSNLVICRSGIGLYLVLFFTAIILLYPISNFDTIENLSILLKNYLVISLFPLLLYLFTINTKKSYQIIAGSVAIVFLVFIGIDHFVQNIFGTRFLYGYVGKFAGNIKDGIPFVIGYLSNYSGLCFILSVLSLVGLFLIKVEKQVVTKQKLTIITVLFGISLIAMFVYNKEEHFRYYNNFQVNINGLFTEGDYKRDYVDYTPYTLEQMDYQKKVGLNLKQNVIVILVESLGCNNTDLCGNGRNLSPYTKELANQNIWFPNYYSNAYHTNGAIFSITTGFPLINGPHGDDTFFNKNLYKYDVVNQFKANGYKTAYFSPAPLILGKDKQLKMSNYDYISFSSDPFYDNSKKNGVFYSANDEELFAKIFHDLRLSKEPVFFMTTTISTHTPYIVPWGSHNIDKAYAYSDMAIKNFIKNLESINYFDNGIVIVTGDHIGWGSNNDLDVSQIVSHMDLHRVPFILINGKDHGIVKDDVSFSHTSLGVMLEYLMLPTYYQNQFQINPLDDQKKYEYVLHFDEQKFNDVYVRFDEREDEVLLDGDQTRFLGNAFSKEEQEKVLGFISYVRQ